MAAARSVVALLLLNLGACPHALFIEKGGSTSEDLYDSVYEKKFTIDLHSYLPDEPEDKIQYFKMPDVLGWRLKGGVGGKPVAIAKIRGGALAQWNKDHPDSQVQEGDEIVNVNENEWLQESTDFLTVLKTSYKKRKSTSDGAFSLGVRRPLSGKARKALLRLRSMPADVSMEMPEEVSLAKKQRSAEDEGPKMKGAGDYEGWEAYETFETFHLAAKLRVLVKYWNELFPEDPMDPAGSGFNSALKWLIEKGNNTDDTAVLERTAAAAATLSQTDKDPSDQDMAKVEVLRNVHSNVVLGAKMEVLLNYWNEIFPEDHIDANGKRYGNALKVLLAKTSAEDGTSSS